MVELCKCGAKLTGNVCSTCGLPADLCACISIDREAQKIRVFIVHRKFNKPVTIVEGITENTKSIASQIKAKLACGGTVKKNHIELQGYHSKRLRDILVKLGYSSDQIDIS
jgi:translation initiation factor 1